MDAGTMVHALAARELHPTPTSLPTHLHIVHATVVHGRYDIRILYKQCASLSRSPQGRVSLFVADDLPDETREGVRIHAVGKPKFGRAGRAVLGSLALWGAIRAADPSLVHLHDPELLPLALVLRAAGTPVVFDMHENLPKEILTKPWISRPVRRVLSRLTRAFQRWACRGIPTVFAETSYAADFPDVRTGAVVLNYPLLSRLTEISQPKATTFTVGYIGVVSAERGAEVTAAALDELARDGIAAAAVFVGPVATDLGHSERFNWAVDSGLITLTGRLEPSEGWPLMAACHVGVAVLAPSPNFVDSYPTKLFEYMALGLPVVVSDFPLWRRVVDDAQCGFVVDPTDVSALAGVLRWLRDNTADAAAMGARGRAAAIARYSWDSEFRKLAAVYDALLPQPTGLATA